jgi:hypothetical protein
MFITLYASINKTDYVKLYENQVSITHYHDGTTPLYIKLCLTE